MHEFPEVQAMVREACKKVPAGASITRLTVIVGEASGHDSRHIREHFAEASRGTPAQGATLKFVREKLAAKCATCRSDFSGNSLSLQCEQCGGTELNITAGNDVRLHAVEWES